ncbi:MAG: DUF2934 domain-containing protein [Thermotogales bacterium]|nr:DUF2934 domain-containing protein [Thermotogales bacterium]
MAQKLTMKALSGELEALHKRLREFETGFERKLENALERATEKLKARIEASDGSGIRLREHGNAVDVDARRQLIAECAYRRAEKRRFLSGSPEQDWLEAEMEIDQLLLQGWIKNEFGEMTSQEAQPKRKAGDTALRENAG